MCLAFQKLTLPLFSRYQAASLLLLLYFYVIMLSPRLKRSIFINYFYSPSRISNLILYSLCIFLLAAVPRVSLS